MAFFPPVASGFLDPSAPQPGVNAGMVVVETAPNQWTPWANAVGTGGLMGVSLNSALPGDNIGVQVSGPVPYQFVNCGSGVAGTVTAGRTPSRGISGDIIGARPDGNNHLACLGTA